MHNDLLYRIALTLVPHIGPVQAGILIEHFGDAAAVFKAKKSMLGKLEGIGEVRARSLLHFNDWQEAEDEIAFIEKYKITPLFLTDADYPRRLRNCYDPPTLLYYRGGANLNAGKIVAIVGTRYKTEYGRHLTETLVRDLAEQEDMLVVSGLALGIDGIAHKAALKNKLPTVGVLAHGLDKLYPPEHKTLAKDMVRQGGGLLTEFRSKTDPDKHHFPTRNRIVAGMSDCVIVVETDVKGGSMITAHLAGGYDREVFTFPGRVTDAKSKGCLQLVRANKATLITGAADLADAMNWAQKPPSEKEVQAKLFTLLSDDEQRIVQLLRQTDVMHIDELITHSGGNAGAVARAMLNLEMENMVCALPGRRYRMQ